jgi:hypothetical protein
MQRHANPQRLHSGLAVKQLWSSSATGATPFTVLLRAEVSDPELHSYYGAPGAVWINYTVTDASAVEVTLQLLNKTATRLGEAIFFDFTVSSASGKGGSGHCVLRFAARTDSCACTALCLPRLAQTAASVPGRWYADVLGLPVDPLDVVTNGGVHQHGVKEGVFFAGDGGLTLWVESVDAAVASPHTQSDEATSLLAPLTPLSGTVTGFSFILFQNAFNTNVRPPARPCALAQWYRGIASTMIPLACRCRSTPSTTAGSSASVFA